MADPKLYWIDLETTGLLPDVPYAQILEIAVAESELLNPFELKHIYHAVFKPTDHVNTWAYMDPFVREMHTKNGLWEECLASTESVSAYLLSKLVPEESDHSDKSLLAGSSVHFDSAWLKYYMGDVAWRFSHRHYDVSAIKLFCQSLGMEKIPKGEAHRAKADIEESALHGRMCVEWLGEQTFGEQSAEETAALTGWTEPTVKLP